MTNALFTLQHRNLQTGRDWTDSAFEHVGRSVRPLTVVAGGVRGFAEPDTALSALRQIREEHVGGPREFRLVRVVVERTDTLVEESQGDADGDLIARMQSMSEAKS